jgi:hypothetical protein
LETKDFEYTITDPINPEFIPEPYQEDVKKHGTGDQKPHGSWANGSGSTNTGLDSMPYKWNPKSKSGETMGSFDYEMATTTFKNVADAPVAIRLYGSDLDAIVVGGRFKSLNEIKNNVDSVWESDEYREGRVELENGVWGVSKNGVQPIYGYMDTDFDGHVPAVENYGDVKITLKDAVSGRTTFVAGDSLNSKLIPVLITDARTGNLSNKALTDASVNEGFGGLTGRRVGYFEAQIHGGVSVSDIKSVEVNKYGRVEQTTYDALKKLGIKVKVESWSK